MSVLALQPAVWPMLQPRYPDRSGSVYYMGENSRRHLTDLQAWLNGGAFHPYGRTSVDLYGVDAILEHKAELEIHGTLDGGHTRWHLYGYRSGNPRDKIEAYGHSDPGDAAYGVLSWIEADERREWEDGLVLGVA